MKLDPEHATMLREVHLLLTDENVGVCSRLKGLEKTVNGNGKIGLAEQVRNLKSDNNKRAAFVAGSMTFATAVIWESIKYALRGKW